jgi:hypothetical protein
LLLCRSFLLRIYHISQVDLISGFSAKSIASGHFIDQRSKETIEKGDNDINLIDLATNAIDEKGQFATASVYGLKERKDLSGRFGSHVGRC